jgi:FdhD protein
MASTGEEHDGVQRRQLESGDEEMFIREEPLMLHIGEKKLLTMRTPGEDRDLALGFLLSEGIVRTAADVVGFHFEGGDPVHLRPDALTIDVREEVLSRIGGRLTRTHEIRSSCGVCGMTDVEAILEETPPLLPKTPRLPRTRIPQLLERFEELQEHFRATGACHGAAIFDPEGTVLGHGEDVGRHNALDKAIGAASRSDHDLANAMALLSGRAGFDLVLKCLRMRIGVILSVSAPSAMSFDMCKAAGATLVGFVRGSRHKVYWDDGRLE